MTHFARGTCCAITKMSAPSEIERQNTHAMRYEYQNE